MGSTRRRPKSVSSKAQTPSPYGIDNAKSEAAGPKPFLDPRLLGSGMVGFRLGSGRLYLGWQLPRADAHDARLLLVSACAADVPCCCDGCTCGGCFLGRLMLLILGLGGAAAGIPAAADAHDARLVLVSVCTADAPCCCDGCACRS